MCGVGRHSAGTHLGAPATGDSARTPLGPVRHNAVHWAWRAVARLRLRQLRALLAAVLGRGRNRARTALCATTARLGARGKRRPGGRCAVHWAGRNTCACLHLVVVAARDATVGAGRRRCARARLRACAAGNRTCRPRRPCRLHAIFWARVRVTILFLREHRAELAAERGRRGHGTRAIIRTSTAGLRARAECGPCRHHAIHGARVRVARLGLGEERAHVATVQRVRGDRARAALRAAAARLGARGKCGPGRRRAVHRAGALVAGLRLAEHAAHRAAVRSRNGHGARAGVSARTARERAVAPRVPRGRGAVNGARVHVARP